MDTKCAAKTSFYYHTKNHKMSLACCGEKICSGGRLSIMNDNKTALYTGDKREIVLWDVIKLLLRKFYWILFSGIILGLVVYLVVTFCVTPTYESRVSFYVYNRSDSTLNSGSVNQNDLQAAESLAETYTQILGSNSVLDAVLLDLGSDVNLTRKNLSEMVKISVVPNTQLLEVIVSSNDAAFACKVADSFVQVAPTEIERITKAGSLEVVDRPEVALEKSAPRTLFSTVIGCVIGAVLSAIVIILKMFSDTTVYLPEDIEKAANVIILGEIPEIDMTENKHFNWSLTNGGVILNDKKEDQKTGDYSEQNSSQQAAH